MNKEVVTIGAAVLMGAITRGGTGMLLDTAENTTKMAVNFLGCAGFGFLATKVSGVDTKAAALRGGAIGSSIALGLQFITAIASTEKAQEKLATTSKLNTFLSKAAGLNSSSEGLAGYIDADGNYHEAGLNGYIDAQGNFIEDGLNASDFEDNELIGYEEYQEETDGLQASIDEYGNIVI